ncbi:CLUMA_CG015609, isoform A [Clunio marinus]|uniref:CLUMA_CG015609, isoform A n=1 Tax=Clunio marinus TaxID=568069 RepID=A0A1J1IP11_9DIPT|nr:CLUMA_CG015609, isoform A [Clunio marinus]
MSRKSRKGSKDKKLISTSDDFFLSCPIDDDNDFDEALSMEFFDCCCFDCTNVDFAQFHGKINFSLDNLCCNFSSRNSSTDKKPKKKKKLKKKNGTPSPIPVETNTDFGSQRKIELPSKALSPKSFNLDPISDQLKHSNRSFSTSDLPGFKGSTNLKMKKPKGNKKSTKLCNTLKSEAPASFQNLCNRFKSSSLSNLLPISRNEATLKNIVHLSDHDKKILDRMSMKNLKELALVENAMMARKYWESEKSERERLKNEQHARYLKMVNEKRRQEQGELMRRKQLIEEKQKEYCERVQNDIAAKSIKAENILKNIEMEREMMECRKRQREYQRIEAIQTNCEESKLDEQIWRETIIDRLEERINKAENIRCKNLDVYRIRVQTDNQLHQQIHAQNYDQAIREEIQKRDQLRERIKDREMKLRKFNEQRQRFVQESKTQAKTSALLRELVKRSFGSFKVPSDTPIQRSCENGRFSNCSYSSQVSHIHLS